MNDRQKKYMAFFLALAFVGLSSELDLLAKKVPIPQQDSDWSIESIGSREECLKAIASIRRPIIELIKKATPKKRPTKNLSRILKLDSEKCQMLLSRNRILKKVSELSQWQGDQVAVFVPKKLGHVTRGLKTALGPDLSNRLITVEPHQSIRNFTKQVADLVVTKNLGAIVGGLEQDEASVLAEIGRLAKIPTLIFHSEVASPSGEKSSPVFHVFPNPAGLAAALARQAKIDGSRRVAIFRPNRRSGLRFAEKMRKQLSLNGLQLVDEISYSDSSFESIENGARQLFRVRPTDRRPEWLAARNRMKRQAARQGVPFNPRMVHLKPLDRVDAVFVPDNFRSVRHIAKVFDFLGVKRIRLYGHHEWRSKNLITPYDPLLDGSLFADFVGDYRSLPKGLGARPAGFFLSSRQAEGLDLRLLGFVAGTALKDALTLKELSKEEVIHFLASRNFPSELSTFASGRMFRKNGHINWPSFLFRVTKKRLVLLGPSVAGLDFVH